LYASRSGGKDRIVFTPVGAMVAARYNPQLKSFRDKLVAAGKPKLIALVAVARKLPFFNPPTLSHWC
jgi:hypothetical protein